MQGRDKACQHLGEHPDLAADLREKLVALRKAENARLGAPVAPTRGESEAAYGLDDMRCEPIPDPYDISRHLEPTWPGSSLRGYALHGGIR